MAKQTKKKSPAGRKPVEDKKVVVNLFIRQSELVEFEKGFQEALKNVLAITDKKESVREYTNLILFDFKDGFCKIVWTNGDILFVSKNFETSYKYTEKKLIEIKELKKYTHWDIEICNADFHFRINGVPYKYKYESYPNYINVLPTPTNKVITFDKLEMIKHINDNLKNIDIKIKISKIVINSNIEFETVTFDDDIKPYKSMFKFKSKTDFDSFEFHINLNLLKRIIKTMDSKILTMSFSTNTKAIEIKSENELGLIFPCLIQLTLKRLKLKVKMN